VLVCEGGLVVEAPYLLTAHRLQIGICRMVLSHASIFVLGSYFVMFSRAQLRFFNKIVRLILVAVERRRQSTKSWKTASTSA
jgi:hypothetical protein